MKTVNQLKMGVILSYISKLIMILVGIIYTPIMIRILGQSEYGIYNIAVSIISYLGVLNFGFGSAYMRFYSQYKVLGDKERIATLNGMFLVIFSILGLLAAIFGTVIALNVEIIFGSSLNAEELSMTRILTLILVINLSASFPVVVFNTYLQANEKFVFQNIIQIFTQLTTPLINLPLLLMDYGSIGMVIGTVIINIITEIIIVFFCIKKIKMRFSFSNFDSNLMKEMTVYSSYIFINMIVDQVNNNIDKTMLGRYQGPVSVAIYSVAGSLNNYYTQISSTISNVFIPRIHQMVVGGGTDRELSIFFTRIGRIQFILLSLVLSGVIFFGRPFIGIWAGQDYYESYKVLLFIIIPITIPLIQNLGIEIQRAKNMHQFRSYMYLFMAVGNIMLSIPLSINYGAAGAAFGTGLSYIIGNGIVMNWYNHTKIGLDMKYFWKEILKFIPAFVLPCLYGVLINEFINLYELQNLLLYGLIYVLIFATSMWFLGMNDYEKGLIRNPFK